MLSTSLAGLVSLTAAAVVSFSLLSRVLDRLVSLSVGIMLSTSLLHALPEALESQTDVRPLFATLLAGLITFFLIEKMGTMGHMHGPESSNHHQVVDRPKYGPRRTGWMILVGDGIHNFTDGILIAAAFLANPGLGLMTGLAIVAHEIPQEISNFIVLTNSGFSRTKAYLSNLLCNSLALVGGLLGYYTLGRVSSLIPYILVFASSGFIYIALSELMPQMQKRATVGETIPQVLLITAGISIVIFTIRGAH